jgi:hypothetical protein
MEFALVLRELLGHKRALLAGVVVAFAVAYLSIASKPLQYSAASTQVFVDSPSSVLGNVNPAITSLTTVATVDANFMTSPAMLDLIAKKVGLTGDQLEASGPEASLPRAMVEPTATQRNVQLTGETAPYRLDYSNNPNLPIVGVDSQAPTTKMAIALANAAVAGLSDYVANLQARDRVPPNQRIVIRQLGSATGQVVNAGIGKKLAVMVFVALFFVWCVGILVASRFRKSWRASGMLYASRDRDTTGKSFGADEFVPSRAVHSETSEDDDMYSPLLALALENERGARHSQAPDEAEESPHPHARGRIRQTLRSRVRTPDDD